MPIYEYKCKSCGHEFEIAQRITESSLTLCPEENCGGEVFRKISKNVGLLFKGSGFYITDYGKKNGTSAPAAHGNGSEKHEAPKNGESKNETPKNGEAKSVQNPDPSKPKTEKKSTQKELA